MSAPTERFGNLVSDYERYRPGYPGEVLAYLVGLGLKAGDGVADVGAGTGISSRMFVELGCVVYGVEPNEPMRAAAARAFAGRENFMPVAGTAEATGLGEGSVSWVVAAQAFHWFDRVAARAEFVRILKPGGRVVLLFNERLVDATPFLREYEEVLLAHANDYAQVNHANLDAGVFGAFFDGYERVMFGNEQVMDLEGLLGRVRSCSYVPHPGEPGWPALEDQLGALFSRHAEGGVVRFVYETQVYVGGVSGG